MRHPAMSNGSSPNASNGSHVSTPCYFDEATSPFHYRSLNGSFVTEGRLVDGACVFETEACMATTTLRFPENGTSFSCCGTTANVEQNANVWYYPMIFFFVPYVIIMVLARVGQRYEARKKEEEQQDGQYTGAGSGPSSSSSSSSSTEGSSRVGMITSGQNYSKGAKIVIAIIYLLGIAALVAESTIMPKSIQQTLAPADRSAQLAMASFLEPMKEIFAFIEDSMAVQVGYALAAGRLKELNALLHVSVIGGAVCGAVAFLISVALALDHTSAAAILNPSSVPNAALIEGGCSLIPTTETVLSRARLYWLLIAGSWLPTFVSKGLLGFFAGTGDMAMYAAPMIVAAIVPVSVWFGGLPSTASDDSTTASLTPMTLLGLAYGIGPWVVALCFFVYLGCRKGLRDRYGLHCVCCRGRNDRNAHDDDKTGGYSGYGAPSDPAAAASSSLWRTAKSVVREGLMLMVVDVTVQLSLTISIYVASSDNFEEAYKIAAAQAAYWTFGPQYLVGSFMFLKVLGAKMIGSGQHKKFVFTFATISIFTISLAIGAVVAAATHGDPVAHQFGESACIFASNASCVTAYNTIFSGGDSLTVLISGAFGPIVGLQLVFLLLRCGLAMCHDFSFMAKASSATFVVVFVPAISIAHIVFNRSTVAMFTASKLSARGSKVGGVGRGRK